MQLSRLSPCQKIEIFAPRYRDKKILIAPRWVGTHNQIIFTKAKHLMEQDWYLSGEVIRNSPIDSNGRIPCYAVDLSELQPLERV